MPMSQNISELLGLGSQAEWPHSEEALVELIQLQKEKEVTKQQHFRLEILAKSTDLLNKCLSVNIPPQLIPMVFSGEAPAEELLQRNTQQGPPMRPQQPQMQSPQRPMYAQYQSPQPYQSHITRSPALHIPAQGSPQNAPLQGPPQGPPPGYPLLGPPMKFQRPHSPAKIGAAAVAHLERSRYPSSPMHKRTHSTPAGTFNAPQINRTPVPQISVTTSPNMRSSGTQHSMMRTMSSIQFINENPGKKRRRASDSKENNGDDEGDITEDEPAQEDSNVPPVGQRKIRHLRTRSENSLLDKPEEKQGTSVKEMAKRIDEQNNSDASSGGAPSSGPKFANNILSA